VTASNALEMIIGMKIESRLLNLRLDRALMTLEKTGSVKACDFQHIMKLPEEL
jgi:hypothetical protein